jgi:hypothetical protein
VLDHHRHSATLIASDLWCCTFEDLHATRQNCDPQIAHTVTGAGLLGEQLLLGSITIVDGRIQIADPLLTLQLPRDRELTAPEEEHRDQVLRGREDELFLERRSYMRRSRLEPLGPWLAVFATDSCERVGRRLLAQGKARYESPGWLRQEVLVPTSDWRVAPARSLASLLKHQGTPKPPGNAAIQPWHVLTLALLTISRISETVFDDLDPTAKARMRQIVQSRLSRWPAARQLVDATATAIKGSAYAH